MSLTATAAVDLQSDLGTLFRRMGQPRSGRDRRLHTDDTRFWTHIGGDPVVGRDAVRDTFAGLFDTFPDFSFETYRVFYGDDHWVLDWALISGDIRFDCLDIVVVSPTDSSHARTRSSTRPSCRPHSDR